MEGSERALHRFLVFLAMDRIALACGRVLVRLSPWFRGRNILTEAELKASSRTWTMRLED